MKPVLGLKTRGWHFNMVKTNEETYSKTFRVVSGDYEHAGVAASEVKSLLQSVQLDPAFNRRVAIAIFEAEVNIVIHAYEGEILFELAPNEITVTIKDKGPGISDIELAMSEGYSTASEEARKRGFGAGMGLSNIKRNADEMSIESEVGEGTTLILKFRIPEQIKN